MEPYSHSIELIMNIPATKLNHPTSICEKKTLSAVLFYFIRKNAKHLSFPCTLDEILVTKFVMLSLCVLMVENAFHVVTLEIATFCTMAKLRYEKLF